MKAFFVGLGFLRRVIHLFKSLGADFIFIHREATPFGPPVIEWFLARVFRKRIIYDFDDAIWLKNQSDVNSSVSSVKNYSKVKKIISWSYRVSAGNEYLANYSRDFNKDVIVNPTTLDTDIHKRSDRSSGEIIRLGWTGSHSTLVYLEDLLPVLDGLETEFSLTLICNAKPSVSYPWINYIEWTRANEINDLEKIDIGLMPLPDNPWTEGKCGFKLLQYMSMEIPSVASPVGVNKKMIEMSGSILEAKSSNEWIAQIEKTHQ